MRSGRKMIKRLLRYAAAGMLLLWGSAVVQCQFRCCSDGEAISGKALAPQSDTQRDVSVSYHANKHTPTPADHNDSLCLSLKSTALADNTFTLVLPTSALLCSLNTLTLAPNAAAADAAAPSEFFRQHKRQDWVSTPEVCLGPAFRSLAPPVLFES